MYEKEENVNINEEILKENESEMDMSEWAEAMQKEILKAAMEKPLDTMKANPELIPVIVKAMVEKYKPIVYACLGELVDIYKDYVNNTEYFALCAQEKKNIYDAYIKVGFTDEQAFAFMMKSQENARRVIDQTRDTMKKVSDQKK